MRTGMIAAVVLLSMPTWTVAQDATAPARTPLGDEAYKLLTLFYEYDREMPLEARVVEKQGRPRPSRPPLPPNCVRDKIVFRSLDSRVVGYLGVPTTGSPPYPCVIALHGIGDSKDGWWEDDSFFRGGLITSALLESGIAVFTPDAQYSGERSYANEFESAFEIVFRKEWWGRFQGMFVQSVIDCRRTVDFLETRPDIDKSRLGVIGYSLGAMETFAFMALDERVKTAVACVTVLRHEKLGRDDVWAPRNFARALGDRPLLMLMGRTDYAYTPQQAERVFGLIPGSTKELVWYESGHRLPAEYVPKAVEWLREGLK